MATGGFFQTEHEEKSYSSQTRGLKKQVCGHRALLYPVDLMQTSREALEGSGTRRGDERCHGLHAVSATGHKTWSPELLQREEPPPSRGVRTKLFSLGTPCRPVLDGGLATCSSLETTPYQHLKSSRSCFYSCLLFPSEDELESPILSIYVVSSLIRHYKPWHRGLEGHGGHFTWELSFREVLRFKIKMLF